MKIQITESEKSFVRQIITGSVQNLQQQIDRIKVLETQLAELKTLQKTCEEDFVKGNDLELNVETKGYLMKLLRAYTYEKVESLIVKLLK